MADLVGKLGQTIKSQVSDFGAGFKQAALAGNPQLFGAAMNGIEKGLGAIGQEFKKDREERRREKQFQEENQNEQRKVDSDILKSLKSIEKLLEALVGKKDGKKSFLDQIKEMLAPLIAAVGGILTLLKEFKAQLGAFVDKIKETFKNVINFLKEKLNKLLVFFDEAVLLLKASIGKLIQFFDDLVARLPNIGEKVTKFFSNIGKYFDDLFNAVKTTRFGEIAGSFATKLKSLFTNVFDELAMKLPKIFDVEIDLIKRLKDVFQNSFFNGRLIQSFDDLKLLFGEAGPLGKFATVLGLVFETLKTGVVDKVGNALSGVGKFFSGLAEMAGLTDLAKFAGEGLSKALKAIPIIGSFLLVIEGIFAFFDTEQLQKTFDTQTIGFKERLAGMAGEILGSLFGLLDLGASFINWAFGIDLRSAKTENGESYEERITSVFSRIIHDMMSWFGNIGMLIGGLLKGDGPQIKSAVNEMSLIVGDWLTAMRNAIAGMADAMIEKANEFLPGSGITFRFGQKVSERDKQKSQDKAALKDIEDENKRFANRAASEKAKSTQTPSKPPSSSSGKSSSIGGGLTPNAQYALDFFQSQGFTAAQAAGIVANLQAESGANLKIDAVGDGGKAYGIAQWHPDRQENFRKVFGKDIRSSSLQEQLQFIIWELNNTEKKAGSKVRAAQSEVETAMLFDQYYERSSGAHRQKRMDMAKTLYASVGGNVSGTMSDFVPDFGYGNTPQTAQAAKAPESINVTAKNTTDQLAILARTENITKDHAKAALDYYNQQIRVDEETKKYRQERAQLEDRFYGTLENGFKNMITAFAGGPGAGTQAGGARRLVEGKIGGKLGELSTTIFGKDMGGEIGRIFTQLGGSYADQIATQVIGPALFKDKDGRPDPAQANRFFNSLASGNKKAAMEDLLFGMTGGKAKTGIRSALGYEQGIAQTAKDLATVIGGPFSTLFNLDGPQPVSQEQQQAKLVSDPIVNAQYDSAQMIVEAMSQGQEFDKNRWAEAKRMSLTGGGTSARTGSGQLMMSLMTGGGKAGAMGRLADTGFNLLNYGITNKIAGDNPFAQAIVGGLVGDLTTAARTGGSFGLGDSLAKAFGLKVAPGASLFDVGYAAYSGMTSTMANVGGYISDFGVKQILNDGMLAGAGSTISAFGTGMSAASGGIHSAGFQSAFGAGGATTAGAIAGAAGNAAMAYTISKTLSGGYSAGSWVNTAAAVGGLFFGPIAGVIGGVVNRAFGRKAPRLTGQGMVGTLSEDVTNLSQYASYVEKGGWFRSDKSYTNYYDFDPKAETQLTNAARDLAMTIRKAGYQIGLGTMSAVGAIRNSTYGMVNVNTTFKYGQAGYDEAYNRGMVNQGEYYYNPYTYGQDITETATKYRMGTRDISEADKAIIDGLKEGTLGKLSDGTIIRLTNVKRQEGSYNFFTGESKSIVTQASVQIISSMNAAYSIAFQEMQKMFSMAVNQSGFDMESLMKQYGDSFIKNAFGPLLDKFVQPGERLYETYDRLTSALTNFDETFTKLGYNVKSFFKTFADDLFAMAAQKDIFMDLYGGREKFLESTSQYFDLFYSQAEKLEYYAEVGRKQMDLALYEANLRGKYTVDSLLGNIGTDFEQARLNYRKVVDQFVKDNEALLSANDPETIKKLAILQGDLAASYYTAAQSIQELNRVGGGSVNKENIIAAAKAIFEADRNQFALGGIAEGPVTGYGATLHGVEAVVPLPNGKEIPVKLSSVSGDVGGNTVVNNIVGNGNATLRSTPTNVFAAPPSAVSSSTPNRVLSSAY